MSRSYGQSQIMYLYLVFSLHRESPSFLIKEVVKLIRSLSKWNKNDFQFAFETFIDVRKILYIKPRLSISIGTYSIYQNIMIRK